MTSVAASLQTAAPHRIVLAFLFATGWAASSSAPSAGPDLVAVSGAAALTVAMSLIRPGFAARETSAAARGAILIVAALGAFGAVGLYAVSGAALAALVATFVVVLEAAFFLPPLELSRHVPARVEMALTEGVLVPIVGFAASTRGWQVPWSLVAVTSIAGTGFVVAAAHRERARPRTAANALASRVPPLVVDVLAVVFTVAATALVLAGRGPALDPERRLLASAVAVICAVFAMLALVDRRPEWRSRRVEILVGASVVSLYCGIVLVLLAA